jgi:hypothetical protein
MGRKGWQLMDVNWRMDENVPNRGKLAMASREEPN